MSITGDLGPLSTLLRTLFFPFAFDSLGRNTLSSWGERVHSFAWAYVMFSPGNSWLNQ